MILLRYFNPVGAHSSGKIGARPQGAGESGGAPLLDIGVRG